MFEEFISEIAGIIDEEINREKNEEKVEDVEAVLDGQEVMRLSIEVIVKTIEGSGRGLPEITSVICNGEKVEGRQENSGRATIKRFDLPVPDSAPDEYFLTIEEVEI